MPLPRTWVNKCMEKGRSYYAPTLPRKRLRLGLVLELARRTRRVTGRLFLVRGVDAALLGRRLLELGLVLVLSRLLTDYGATDLLAPRGCVGRERRHAPERHNQRQHQRRDQQSDALPHSFSPPFARSLQQQRPKERDTWRVET